MRIKDLLIDREYYEEINEIIKEIEESYKD